MRRLLLLLALAAACPSQQTTPPASTTSSDLLTPAEQDALTAAFMKVATLRREEADAGLAAIRDAARINAGDDTLLYLEANVLAAVGRTDEALAALARLDAAGSLLVPQPRDFPGLAGPEFDRLVAAARARLPPSRSVRAHTLAERDLIPEGIAHDPATGTFFVGSIYRRKIVAVDPRGSARDLVPPGGDGLYSPLGMKFDARRNALWIASAALPNMHDYVEAEHKGRAALFEFDPTTGRARARYPLDPPGQHLLNDLVLGPAGEVYVTDSEAGDILVLRPGPDARLQPLAPTGALAYPNGIALGDDGDTLFVADFVRGVTSVSIATGERRPLPHPRGVSVRGFDGLYFRGGALIAVENGTAGGRIVRLTLSPAYGRTAAATDPAAAPCAAPSPRRTPRTGAAR